MSTKTKKVLMFIVPLAIAGAIVYVINKKKGKKGIDEKASDNDVKPAYTAPVVSSVFPLKQGSRGEKVKDLQRIIGADPDGVFGPMTENSLIQFAGVRVVNDQAHLDALRNKAIGITSQPRAFDLLAKFQRFASNLQMYVIKTTVAPKVVVDNYGAINYTGTGISLAGGKVYSREDYVLKSVTKEGKLVFDINKGSLLGSYVIDPNAISLK